MPRLVGLARRGLRSGEVARRLPVHRAGIGVSSRVESACRAVWVADGLDGCVGGPGESGRVGGAERARVRDGLSSALAGYGLSYGSQYGGRLCRRGSVTGWSVDWARATGIGGRLGCRRGTGS